MAAHKVTAALVTAVTRTGVRHFYFGDVLPPDVTDASLANLKALGFVSSESEPEGAGGDVERPAEAGPGSAKEKWFAYAAHHKVTVDAEASKEDIIAAVAAAGH